MKPFLRGIFCKKCGNTYPDRKAYNAHKLWGCGDNR